MKKFRINYSPIIYILLAIVTIIFGVSTFINVLNVISFLSVSTIKAVIYFLLALISFLLLTESVFLFFKGMYVIKNGYVYLYFGLIYSKNKIENIVNVYIYKKSKKLVVFFSDKKYTVIIINEKYYDEFIKSLKEQNPNILIDFINEEED